ncbi:transporter [Rhodococcus sp. ABRD24]|uniref:nuclear transport factor 2 family protein n=1 Tax=Rhodococcus sp. ABRD24 TaxID=2507582 RepID=UPI00103F34D2|nr:nuclear transport factor 2 family protein [Rhodococcus sp. ABRD24]QBJ98051.1 transporter [Rhodococcus sp. ABRD24]
MSATPIEPATITRATTAQEILDLARQSPTAVAEHDKTAWLGLFADRHVVEDPVGGRPVLGGLFDRRTGRRGGDPLARFWDTFIAPNEIRFHVEHDDIVSGLNVVRDVTIETGLGGGVVAKAPMHLLYETTLDEGAPRIRRIAAHWEVAPMFAQVAGVDAAKLRVAAGMSARMLRLQGLGGALAFGLAVRSVGERGKQAVRRLVESAQRGDRAALEMLGGRPVSDVTKMIAAGDTVTASCTADGAHAVLFCYLNRKDLQVTSAVVYT